MINKKQKITCFLSILTITLFFQSCKKDYSPTTGWEYNNPKNGGFEVVPYSEQETGPGLVFLMPGIIFQEELLYLLFIWTKPK